MPFMCTYSTRKGKGRPVKVITETIILGNTEMNNDWVVRDMNMRVHWHWEWKAASL